MNKQELETLLVALDNELVKAFPHSGPIEALVVGGACLLFKGVSERPTKDIDIIILDLLGQGQASLIFKNKVTDKVRTIIRRVGRIYGLTGKEADFLNTDCMPFLLEMGDVPPTELLVAYQKLRLYTPPLPYILACKLMANRSKDEFDIELLCNLLHVRSRAQAQGMVNRYFPSLTLQYDYALPMALTRWFGAK